MKVTIDIDCTPEEARRFMGLPDLGPIHDAYLDKMSKAMTEGLSPDVMTEMMKSWGPMGETGLAMMTQIFKQGGK
ncbi:MAG: hypothetical protein H0W74_01640 [Sphingosinicella sp.]|nr:hypothetical protein [Sphingosinicella sp.]